MAIEFRDVTQLEPLEALEDGDYLVVVRDGVAKRISKENAKFGGGAETKVFYYGEKQNQKGYYTLYTDAACATLATAQEVFDACWERTIGIYVANTEQSSIAFPQVYSWVSSDGVGAHTNVVYTYIQLIEGFVDVGVNPNDK